MVEDDIIVLHFPEYVVDGEKRKQYLLSVY